MLNHATCTRIAAIANMTDIEPEALMAVIEVESNGKFFARIEGKLEPLIRFEGHYFYRLLPKEKRALAVKKGLASPKAGAIKNSPHQSKRWKLLKRAIKLHRIAALSSTSWGVGQVMGSHWQTLRFGSIDAFVSLARTNLEGQMEVMVRFITHEGLISSLNTHQWAKFARRYNGPNYRKNNYHIKLQHAYQRYKTSKRCAHFLSFGCKGGNVQLLQKYLNNHGALLKLDGIFGIQTRDALRNFQMRNNLRVDGIAGEKTLQKLGLNLSRSIKKPAQNKSWFSKFINWLFGNKT